MAQSGAAPSPRWRDPRASPPPHCLRRTPASPSSARRPADRLTSPRGTRNTSAEAPRSIDVPGEVEGFFDLLDHGHDGVDQEQDTDGAEHGALHVFDESHDPLGDDI